MFSSDDVKMALTVYHQCNSVTETIQRLGYPTRRTLYTWIANEGKTKTPRKALNTINTPQHPRNPPIEIKIEAIHRCFELGEGIQSVSREIGYSRASIYCWRKKYLRGGAVALMNDKNIRPGTLTEGTSFSSDPATLSSLQTQLRDMQMEIDILKETINVLKKDPGVNMVALKNREKAVIVDALKNRYSLSVLLQKLELSKSSYYYQEARLKQSDKYTSVRQRIVVLFDESVGRYGYRRIHGMLRKENITVSEKVVRRIMREERLVVRIKKRRKYSSYKGEVLPSVPDVIQRDFHATRPNEKWLTDITEFAIPSGKVYLSSIVDCFDGMLLAWTISTVPNSVLANSMLDQAVAKLSSKEHPIVHSDRGCHYRWPGWIKRMEQAGLTRSMSKQGCSPDNAACEGVFGRLKNEMFYNREWKGVKHLGVHCYSR